MKEHFAEYRDIESQIKELEFKLHAKEADLYDIRAAGYTELPSGSPHGDNLVFRIAEKDEVLKQINELKIKRANLYNKHVKEIAKVSDERMRSILRSYYLHRMDLDSIATMLKLSKDHVKRLKREAIIEFKEKNKLTPYDTI